MESQVEILNDQTVFSFFSSSRPVVGFFISELLLFTQIKPRK